MDYLAQLGLLGIASGAVQATFLPVPLLFDGVRRPANEGFSLPRFHWLTISVHAARYATRTDSRTPIRDSEKRLLSLTSKTASPTLC